MEHEVVRGCFLNQEVFAQQRLFWRQGEAVTHAKALSTILKVSKSRVYRQLGLKASPSDMQILTWKEKEICFKSQPVQQGYIQAVIMAEAEKVQFS